MSSQNFVFVYLINYWNDWEIIGLISQLNKFWRDYCQQDFVKKRYLNLLPTMAWLTINQKKIVDFWWYPESGMKLFEDCQESLIFWGQDHIKKMAMTKLQEKFIITTLENNGHLKFSESVYLPFIKNHQGNIDNFIFSEEGLIILTKNKVLIGEFFSIEEVDQIYVCHNQLLYYSRGRIYNGNRVNLGKINKPEKLLWLHGNLYAWADENLYLWVEEEFIAIHINKKIIDVVSGYFLTQDKKLYCYHLLGWDEIPLPKKSKILKINKLGLNGHTLILSTY